MVFNALIDLKDKIHAQLCYQLFVTPLPLKIHKEYQDFAIRACEFITQKRTQVITVRSPRHHVLHHFAQDNPDAKKILITHGWTSRAAYMIRTIRFLHKEGYEVYALDFPAHGEARGYQLTWFEAATILKNTINTLGPFYGVIGHSFGGAMLLNTLNLAGQLPDWELNSLPERAVLMASPTTMRTPVSTLARRIGLSSQGFLKLCETIQHHSHVDIKHLNFRHFIHTGQTEVLCIHGEEDETIAPRESIQFCRRYPHASLALLPGVDHIGVLIDKRVERMVSNFLS